MLAIVVASLVDRRLPSPSRSTLNPDPSGTQALWGVLSELAVPARRWRLPHDELVSARGVLVMVAPFEEPLDEQRVDAILRWVGRGNALLLATSAGEALLSQAVPWNDEDLLVRLGWTHHDFLPPEGEAAPDASARALGSDGAKEARAVIASPLFADGTALAGGPGIRMPSPRGAWAPLLGSAVGTRGWLGTHGRGQVVVLACPSILENRWLDQAGNLSFVLALVERLRGAGEVLFDETVHGQHELRPGTTLDRDARRVVAVHVLLAALVYVLGRGRRLGPPLPVPSAASRSTVELAESMAALYRRGDVGHEALAALARDFRASGVREPELEVELERRLASRTIAPRELVRLDRWMTRVRTQDQGGTS